jgi:hypothetical protein
MRKEGQVLVPLFLLKDTVIYGFSQAGIAIKNIRTTPVANRLRNREPGSLELDQIPNKHFIRPKL